MRCPPPVPPGGTPDRTIRLSPRHLPDDASERTLFFRPPRESYLGPHANNRSAPSAPKSDGPIVDPDAFAELPSSAAAEYGRPFEQIENQHSKKHQGSGLGLALSKSLVEMHGGALRIDSVLGKGTTVSFSLPRQARPQPGDAEEASGGADEGAMSASST